MDLLLDTHAFIWFLNGDNRLPVSIKKFIENTDNNCSLSIASIWEMAIKISLKKLDNERSFEDIAGFS